MYKCPKCGKTRYTRTSRVIMCYPVDIEDNHEYITEAEVFETEVLENDYTCWDCGTKMIEVKEKE